MLLEKRQSFVNPSNIKIFLFLGFFFIYFACLTFHLQDEIDSATFAEIYSLVEYGQFDLRQDIKIPDCLRWGPGKHFGMEGLGGKTYNPFGLSTSWFALPFYLLGKLFGNVLDKPDLPFMFFQISSAFYGAMIVVLSYMLCMRQKLRLKTSLIIALLIGLASPIWHLSTFFNRELLLIFLMLAALNLLDSSLKKKYSLLLSGLMLGVCVLMRVPALGCLPAFCFYIYQKNKSSRVSSNLLFLLPVLISLLARAMVNVSRFGSVFGYHSLINDLSKSSEGLSGLFADNILVSLWSMLFSVGKGFFILCPLVALVFITYQRCMKTRFEYSVFTLILFFCNYLGFGVFRFWYFPASFGPRYLYILIPFLYLLLGFGIESSAKHFKRVVLGFGLVSFMIWLPVGCVDYREVEAYRLNSSSYSVEYGKNYRLSRDLRSIWKPHFTDLRVYWKYFLNQFFGNRFLDGFSRIHQALISLPLLLALMGFLWFGLLGRVSTTQLNVFGGIGLILSLFVFAYFYNYKDLYHGFGNRLNRTYQTLLKWDEPDCAISYLILLREHGYVEDEYFSRFDQCLKMRMESKHYQDLSQLETWKGMDGLKPVKLNPEGTLFATGEGSLFGGPFRVRNRFYDLVISASAKQNNGVWCKGYISWMDSNTQLSSTEPIELLFEKGRLITINPLTRPNGATHFAISLNFKSNAPIKLHQIGVVYKNGNGVKSD